MSDMETPLHVIFGAGQVGYPLAERLVSKGMRVRVAKRSRTDVPAGADIVLGDAADASFCAEAAKGASAVYHCMNPPYSAKAWAELVPRYMDNLIAASAKAGARLVVLDNLYMLGRTGGKPMNEDTPVSPCSGKGEIRARAAERLFDAHRRGEVRAVCGRASDFYGPRGTAGTHLGDFFWKPALGGKTARVLIDPDAIHTYHYIPDVAAGLAVLGTCEDDALGRPWMLPCAPAETLRQLVARMSRALGRPLRVGRVPRWIVRIAGLVVPLMRELDEMMYQWEEPFIVDDRRFRERFGAVPTDRDAAARATVEWAARHYGT
jgi:nucleoside-diphosphate-sugar epimerase